MPQFIEVRRHEFVYEILLARPGKRNAIHLDMLDELEKAIDNAEKAKEARVIILRSEGRGFCAGIGLTGFDQIIERFGENWRNNLFPVTDRFQSALNKLERSSLPVICLAHGYCLGLGMELALACDFRIVAEETQMGLPESRLGIIPDVGGTSRLVKLVGSSRAKEIIMTGVNIDLDDAERWGLINYVVPEAQLMDRGMQLAREIQLSAPLAVSSAKRVINDLEEIPRGLRLEAWAQAQLFRTKDFEIGMQAAILKEQPQWTGE